MFENFQDYVEVRRPILEEAFNRELAVLLRDVMLRDALPLMTSLEAGKKIRGCLSCLVNDALGGTLESALPRAVAVELIQTATLIHDDFVDQDTTRRNLPAAWTLEGARRAVLIGDAIFATAIKMMSDLGGEDGAVVSHAIAQVSKGALHEPLDLTMVIKEIESNRWDDGLYEKIIHLKTGVLFGTACHLGAIAAGANGKLRDTSFRYGLRIGEAYQIADDLKEVKQYLSEPERFLRPERMMTLAPAFLHFVNGVRPYILTISKGKGLDLDDHAPELFRTVVKLMEKEIERRLKLAISKIGEDFPDNEYSHLVRKAPWELIRMFNES